MPVALTMTVQAPPRKPKTDTVAWPNNSPKARRGLPLSPTYADGHRWPQPLKPPRTVWRLTVSYWRIATAARPLDAPQARLARRSMQDLAPDTLQAISRAPMRPIKPQQPLDIGLFEIRPPDAPHIVMPDE